MTQAATITETKIQSPAMRAALTVAAVGGFAALTAASAQLRIPLPFTPVPLTLQVFIVLLCGAVLGRGRGVAAQAIYVTLGAVGLPVFTGAAAGLAYLLGPTGGYLMGFVLAPLCVATVMGRTSASPARLAGAMAAGVAVIYACGWAWLAFGLHLGIIKAFYAGVLPFIGIDIFKAAAAAVAAAPFTREHRLF
jgi:biotin transport system substrate-specific component